MSEYFKNRVLFNTDSPKCPHCLKSITFASQNFSGKIQYPNPCNTIIHIINGKIAGYYKAENSMSNPK